MCYVQVPAALYLGKGPSPEGTQGAGAETTLRPEQKRADAARKTKGWLGAVGQQRKEGRRGTPAETRTIAKGHREGAADQCEQWDHRRPAQHHRDQQEQRSPSQHHLRQVRGVAVPITTPPAASARSSGRACRQPYLQPTKVRRGHRGSTDTGRGARQGAASTEAAPGQIVKTSTASGRDLPFDPGPQETKGAAQAT
ncbi:hypothetical protein NDU88_005941 [Pleurodeles waltl]|uniref:Uncharacterized protein n=1 Tax=Pleurodeles waltl TaxID=8319 RepID=A0AAV7TVE1_PLEWA|nr:hypothetical protein NDU88_005941 [Pleurodeles waltl]